MLFELTNEQRLYLGLAQVESSWDLVQLKDSTYIYFDKDKLCKKIEVTETSYHEMELDENTTENRTILLPKTAKGKNKKLNYTGVSSCGGVGVYFLHSDATMIANYTTQTTFYSTHKVRGFKELKNWLDWWVKDSTEEDLKEIQAFKTAKRQHCKVKEGAFFSFKINRREYGFGRVLLDIRTVKKGIKSGAIKEKQYGLTHIMGQPLIVKVYKKVSKSQNIDLDELKNTEAFNSQQIMDNVFYYGEYKVIGNKPLEPSELEFPISYSRSINSEDRDTVYLQYGMIYKETNIKVYSKYLKDPKRDRSDFFQENPFRNEGVGFGVDGIETLLNGDKPSVKEDNDGLYIPDLRHPNNKKIKREIFSFFGLDADKSYAENLKLVTK